MATYIEITTVGTGFELEYNSLSSAVKFKRAFVKNKDILNIALSEDESWVEVETINKTYQFTYPTSANMAIIETINGVTMTSNLQIYNTFKTLINV